MPNANRNFSALPVNFQVPDLLGGDWSLSPKWAALIAKHEPAAINLASAHKRLRDGVAEIISELRRPVTTITPERHFIDMHKVAQQWLTATAKTTQSARDAANSRLAELNSEITAKMRCNDNSFTGKLRDRIYAMKPADRNEFAAQAIEAGDRSKMAAFFNGDAVLCGFTDAQQKAFRGLALQKHAGDLLETKDNLTYAHDIVFNAFNDALTTVGKLFPPERVKQLQSEIDDIASARNRLSA